ncbi:hypothetical protein EVA_17529 [gut metagenome]|uniref:Uncharacterized protein n=1 Tax=gut metagenome TaxID=749906 RepID=J9FXT3_9ZZZZ
MSLRDPPKPTLPVLLPEPALVVIIIIVFSKLTVLP